MINIMTYAFKFKFKVEDLSRDKTTKLSYLEQISNPHFCHFGMSILTISLSRLPNAISPHKSVSVCEIPPVAVSGHTTKYNYFCCHEDLYYLS